MNYNVTSIVDFKLDKEIFGYFLCLDKKKKRARSGKFFLDLLLQDGSGIISAKLWDNLKTFQDRFNIGSTICVKAIVDKYDDQLFLRLKTINNVLSNRYEVYGFNRDFIFSEKISFKSDWGRLLKHAKSMSDVYSRLFLSLLNDYKSLIVDSSIRPYPYKQIPGTKLKFSLLCFKNSITIVKNCPILNRDFIYSAIFIFILQDLLFESSYSLSQNKVNNKLSFKKHILKRLSQISKSSNHSDIIEMIFLFDEKKQSSFNPEFLIAKKILELNYSVICVENNIKYC